MSDLQAMIVQMGLTTKLSGRQIGEQLGCSGTYANEILKKAGIEKGYRFDWELWEDKIVDMLDDDYTQIEIAQFIGCDVGTLRYHLYKHGYTKRTKFEAVKCKVEITPFEALGRKWKDITDVMIERPCIIDTNIPEWKRELQERFNKTNGEYGINFGYQI